MRIAYVMNSLEGGGAALPVPRVIDVMRDAGAEVTIFALERRDGRAIPAIERAGVPIRLCDSGGGHLDALRWLDAGIAAYRPTHLWTSLTRATAFGQAIGLRRRLPVASWQHAAWLRPANRRLLRLTQRLTALWVADSESVAAFTADTLGVPPSRLAVWPIFAADPDAARAAAWRPGETVRIGSLGRLHPVKGYEVLIEAMRIVLRDGAGIAPFTLSIAGEGALRDRLEQLAAEGGVPLALPGFTPDPQAWLAGLHLYLQPSRSEGFCVSVHQAMQAGLPVISSAVGEPRRSIEPGGTGLLVPPRNPVALAQALRTVLAAPETLAAMGAQARLRVNAQYGADRFRAAGEAALRQLAALAPG